MAAVGERFSGAVIEIELAGGRRLRADASIDAGLSRSCWSVDDPGARRIACLARDGRHRHAKRSFILVPCFLSSWGVATYGEWLSLTAVVAFVSFTNAGSGARTQLRIELFQLPPTGSDVRKFPASFDWSPLIAQP